MSRARILHILPKTVLFRQNKSEDVPYVVPRKKWWLPPLIGLAVLGALGIGGIKAYRRIEPARLAKRAKVMMANGDYRSAAVTLTRALQINPNSDAATRLTADLMEQLQMPQALDWRQRVAELNPSSAPDALAWANLALKESKTGVAERALNTVPAEQRGTAPWHASAGLTAIRAGRWQTAREHFLEATRLEPKNDMHRYNLALVQVQSPSASEREIGLATLSQAGLQGRVEIFAQRALVAQLLRDGKTEEALARSTALVAKPDAEVVDHVTHLDLLRRLNRPEWPDALNVAEQKAAGRAIDVSVLLQWCRLRGLADRGVDWAGQLPDEMKADPAVQAARGDCLFALKRWGELRTAAEAENWGPANPRRLALLSRTRSELGDPNGSSSAWAGAVRAAKTDRGQLARLAALASEWDWKIQMRDALWAAAESAGPDWALRTLHGSYLTDGDTAGLLRVARRQIALNPNDLRARNNLAQCSLLLESDVAQALAVTLQLAKEAPDDAVVRSTLGFALLANGKPEDALKEMERIPADQRRKPAVALYFGLVLRANGDAVKAREYLEIAGSGPLLPEEKRLRDAALADSGRR